MPLAHDFASVALTIAEANRDSLPLIYIAEVTRHSLRSIRTGEADFIPTVARPYILPRSFEFPDIFPSLTTGSVPKIHLGLRITRSDPQPDLAFAAVLQSF